MSIQFSLVTSDEGQQFVTVFAGGQITPPAPDDHPNFSLIVAACEAALRGEDVDAEQVVGLFDVAKTVSVKFQQLTERVSVENGTVYLDGDPVHGSLQEQIIDFVQAGEDFGPLVSFYEKLVTNPLGDVREGLYDWIRGQTENGEGTLTITTDGDLIGYKSVKAVEVDGETRYRPSRASNGGDRVNGVEVEAGKFIEQAPGDVVEMPRSKVLHAPSRACGDGLHIGTWGYASTFYGGNTVLLVKFSPRDIVSLPDTNSTWKLRVCRYTVLGVADGPLDVPLYLTEDAKADLTEDAADLILDGPLAEGDRLADWEGDEGTVESDGEGGLLFTYDESTFGSVPVAEAEVGTVDEARSAPGVFYSRIHGKGGPTSQRAKGRGRNAAQDAKGRFSQGRPGSARDGKSGRFAPAA